MDPVVEKGRGLDGSGWNRLPDFTTCMIVLSMLLLIAPNMHRILIVLSSLSGLFLVFITGLQILWGQVAFDCLFGF